MISLGDFGLLVGFFLVLILVAIALWPDRR